MDFFTKYNGRYVDYDGYYGFQCVDLMRQYVKDMGLKPYVAIPATGTARNIFRNFKENKYFKKILNTPSNVPQKGDIMFWGYFPFLYGSAGHVGIVSKAWLMSLITFDQNYPTGRPCQFVKHSYKGALGWLRRK